MENKLKILMIGAHPDDCEFYGGGTALKYLEKGHIVKYLSTTNGCCGHQSLLREELIRVRQQEMKTVEDKYGVLYEAWDVNDTEVIADLKTREKMVKTIREFNPDIIFTHRTNDYHADHRNTSLLVQDASYLLIVPSYLKEVQPLNKKPVIMFFCDDFKNPPFTPNIAVDITDVIDKKYDSYFCHKSQLFEWLPYASNELHLVPNDENERVAWYKSPLIPRDKVLTVKKLEKYKNRSDYRDAYYASLYRKLFNKTYKNKGKKVIFGEVFETSEYGAPITEQNIKTLFPF